MACGSPCAPMHRTKHWKRHMTRSSSRVRPRSISNGRSRRCWRPCAISRAMSAPTRLYGGPVKTPKRTWPSTGRSGGTGWKTTKKLPRGRKKAKPGTWSPISMPACWATVDFGTATAPIYTAHDKGLQIHVFADETRPRNQGAALTAWELGHHGVPHTVIADNTGGHLMQHKMVDLVIVGADRVTAQGDV